MGKQRCTICNVADELVRTHPWESGGCREARMHAYKQGKKNMFPQNAGSRGRKQEGSGGMSMEEESPD